MEGGRHGHVLGTGAIAGVGEVGNKGSGGQITGPLVLD